MELQQQFWHDLNGMWWTVEDRRVGATGDMAQRLAVAQKAVERALCEAASGRLSKPQWRGRDARLPAEF